MIDDGFTYYDCSGCTLRKMAALFSPAEIAAGTLRCMACTGQVSRNPRNKGRNPSPAHQQWARNAPQPVYAGMSRISSRKVLA